MRQLASTTMALSLAASAIAAGPTAPKAKAFMAGIFAGYEKPEPPDLLRERAGTAFTPRLIRLIHQDAAAAHGESGALDYDPICGCQDFALSNLAIKIEQTSRAAAGAVVDFDNAGVHQAIRFDLAVVHGHWRIADIHDDRVPSLVDFLKQHATRTAAAH